MMRAVLLWLALGAAFDATAALAAMNPAASAPRADSIAWSTSASGRAALISSVTSYLAQVSFGTPWSRWRAQHGRAACARFRGSSDLKGPAEYWVFRCSDVGFSGELEFVFYLLDDDEAPTLERVNWTLDVTPPIAAPDLAAVRRDLADTLKHRFARMSVTGERSWPGFSGDALTTHLGAIGFDGGFDEPLSSPETWVGAQHISRRLARAISRVFGYDSSATAPSGLSDGEGPLGHHATLDTSRAIVLEALHPRWPRLAEALASPRPRRTDPALLSEALRQAAQHDVPAREHDLVVFAVHSWLVDHWAADSMAMDSTLARAASMALGAFGVTLGVTYGGARCLDDSVLVGSLLERAGTNPWADRVFLEFMDRGWGNPCALCGWGDWFGADQFRPVIARGEAFLRGHPRSRVWRDVALLVAEAHETAWSLSKADDSEVGEGVYIDSQAYERDAPEHRRRAIELYERLLREDSRIAGDPGLRRRLRRMRLGVDTGFHRYWCVWD